MMVDVRLPYQACLSKNLLVHAGILYYISWKEPTNVGYSIIDNTREIIHRAIVRRFSDETL